MSRLSVAYLMKYIVVHNKKGYLGKKNSTKIPSLPHTKRQPIPRQKDTFDPT